LVGAWDKVMKLQDYADLKIKAEDLPITQDLIRHTESKLSRINTRFQSLKKKLIDFYSQKSTRISLP